jgi:carboxylesterase type B
MLVPLTKNIKMGAFGFLSSSDVDSRGVVNAGLLDQISALSWVQKYISSFGGDPNQVTVAAQSAGAGSVMYHALADDGNTKPSLFRYVR